MPEAAQAINKDAEVSRSYVVRRGTEEVHIFSEHLAKRPDMVRVEGTLAEAKAKAKQMFDDYMAAKEEQPILYAPNNPPNIVPGTGVDMSEPVPSDVNVDDVVAAIDLLEPGNPKHFTANGLPRIEAITDQLSGAEISADLRDKAWAALSRQRASQ